MKCCFCESENLCGLRTKKMNYDFLWCKDCDYAYPYGLDSKPMDVSMLLKLLDEPELCEEIPVEAIDYQTIRRILGLGEGLVLDQYDLLNIDDFPIAFFLSMVKREEVVYVIQQLFKGNDYSYNVEEREGSDLVNIAKWEGEKLRIRLFNGQTASYEKIYLIYYCRLAVDNGKYSDLKYHRFFVGDKVRNAFSEFLKELLQ